MHCTTLTSLNLSLALIEATKFAQITSTWKDLTSVQLRDCSLKSACNSTIGIACPKLRLLGLQDIPHGNRVDVMRSCRLESLTLAQCHVSNAVCTEMAEYSKNLRTLFLKDLRHVGDEGLTAVAKNCLQLLSLHLDTMGITSAAVDTFFAHCPLLQSVTLRGGGMDIMEGRTVRSAAAHLPDCTHWAQCNIKTSLL